jgi:hypothetical protein
MTKNTNSKRRYGIEDKNWLVSVIEILNLFEICLPAVFLAGCLCIGFLPCNGLKYSLAPDDMCLSIQDIL